MKKDAMATKLGDLEMASQVWRRMEENASYGPCIMCGWVFTSWLGPRRAPADAAEQAEAGKLQGEFCCCPHANYKCMRLF